MKKLLLSILLLISITTMSAQNELKARIEYEEAEKSFNSTNYDETLKHVIRTLIAMA